MYKVTFINIAGKPYYRAEYQANGTWYWVHNAWGRTAQFAREEEALAAAKRAAGV